MKASKTRKLKSLPFKTEETLVSTMIKSDTVSDFGEQSDITKGIVSEEEEFLTLGSLDTDNNLHAEKNKTEELTEVQEPHLTEGEELLESVENILGNENIEENINRDVDDHIMIPDVESEEKTENTSWWRREDTIGGRLFEARTLAEIDGFLSVGQVQ